MDKTPAVNRARFVNVRLLKELAAAKADRVVVSAAANQNKTGVWASPEQVLLATSLRATADQIFKVTMREWSKLR